MQMLILPLEKALKPCWMNTYKLYKLENQLRIVDSTNSTSLGKLRKNLNEQIERWTSGL
jgi:hypothetical protein